MSTIEELAQQLKRLRMPGIMQSLDLRIQQAVEDNLSHEDFLCRLLTDEVERRDAKQLQLRLRKAAFSHDKTLESFDFEFNGSIPKSKIIDLATCRFLDRHENVLLIGPAGVGKSHLAQALGYRACRLRKNVMCLPAHQFFTQLRAARADNSLDNKLAAIARLDLLILDDLGLQPLPVEGPSDLYEVIRLRYERASTVVTSNRSIEEWYQMFADDLLASAAMDRLLHHVHIVELNGKSYRNPPRVKAA